MTRFSAKTCRFRAIAALSPGQSLTLRAPPAPRPLEALLIMLLLALLKLRALVADFVGRVLILKELLDILQRRVCDVRQRLFREEGLVRCDDYIRHSPADAADAMARLAADLRPKGWELLPGTSAGHPGGATADFAFRARPLPLPTPAEEP